jgi:hypothetical protein
MVTANRLTVVVIEDVVSTTLHYPSDIWLSRPQNMYGCRGTQKMRYPCQKSNSPLCSLQPDILTADHIPYFYVLEKISANVLA